MADNTSQAGSATIAADDVTTLNGSASSGVLVQRVKVAFGDDNTARDASASFPLPVTQATSIPAGTNLIGSVRKAPSTTGTITSVTAAATSTQLLATNNSRLGATFFNDSTATLYLALSSAASTTSYTVQVPAGGYYELPNDSLGYVGPIFGLWSAVNGAARVTELT